MPSDHVHVRGETIWGSDDGWVQCTHCRIENHYTWWRGYESAIADVQYGLPDHERRVEHAFDNVLDMGSPSLGVVRAIIKTYLAPLPSEEE